MDALEPRDADHHLKKLRTRGGFPSGGKPGIQSDDSTVKNRGERALLAKGKRTKRVANTVNHRPKK